MVFETEFPEFFLHAVLKEGSDDAKRSGLGEKGRRGIPGVQVYAVTAEDVDLLPPSLFDIYKAEITVLSELFADSGFVRHGILLKVSQPVREPVHDFCDGQAPGDGQTFNDGQILSDGQALPVLMVIPDIPGIQGIPGI